MRLGTATHVKENGGYVDIQDGATVSFDSGSLNGLTLTWASATVHSMTEATGNTVDTNGKHYIYSGGIASGTTVKAAGELHVSSGGVASATTMNSGTFSVKSGAATVNTTVNGGAFQVSSGGTATGKLTFGGERLGMVRVRRDA